MMNSTPAMVSATKKEVTRMIRGAFIFAARLLRGVPENGKSGMDRLVPGTQSA
ncbi:MAG TPA: hypothetical protein VF501_07630 [Thiobacillus sp.]